MPYRIKARSEKGHTVTMMDLDPTHRAIMDRAYAQQLADEFARTRPHGANGKNWQGIVEHYTESIANPNWDRNTGTIRSATSKKR
jgi:hypothetical protein